MMAGLADYPALHYFMQCYWNQMGDEVHGTLAQAVADFCALESDDYQRRLFDDLQRADQTGVIPDEPDWDDERYAAFWEDRLLTKSDLADAQIALARAGSRQ
jgi:hypothetical protein